MLCAAALGQQNGEMHHRPGRFADPRGVVDAFSAEFADQDVLASRTAVV